MNLESIVQAVIAMLVITSPPDPAKVLLFNSILDDGNQNRMSAALKVAVIVFCILAGAALGGGQLAQLLGIDLNAFSVIGGIVVAGMGFEMLYGGKPSKTQGKNPVDNPDDDESSGLIMPLSIPLIAGPGAIVTTITIASSEESGIWAALIGAGAVALVIFVTFYWLGGMLSRLSPSATALMLRLGGMLLATIGMQMLLGGLKNYFSA